MSDERPVPGQRITIETERFGPMTGIVVGNVGGAIHFAKVNGPVLAFERDEYRVVPDAAPVPRSTPNRWAALTTRELGAIVGAFEAADREDSIDDIGKALHAQAAEELDRRRPETP